MKKPITAGGVSRRDNHRQFDKRSCFCSTKIAFHQATLSIIFKAKGFFCDIGLLVSHPNSQYNHISSLHLPSISRAQLVFYFVTLAHSHHPRALQHLMAVIYNASAIVMRT